MRRMMGTQAVILLGILAVCWDYAGAANVAQVDRIDSWICPTPTGTTGDFFDVPDLHLSMKTDKGSVLLMMNFSWHGTASGAVWLEPVIDGQQLSADRLSWQTGNDGHIPIVAFQRVYPLHKGEHTFGVRFSCQAQITVLRAWLTVYELR